MATLIEKYFEKLFLMIVRVKLKSFRKIYVERKSILPILSHIYKLQLNMQNFRKCFFSLRAQFFQMMKLTENVSQILPNNISKAFYFTPIRTL